MERRKFINTLSKTVGSAAVLSMPMLSKANNILAQKQTITVGEIMDLFMKQIPVARFLIRLIL